MAWVDEVRANRNNWSDVEGLHVERNPLVGCSNLDIVDSHCRLINRAV
jgi:hypothetical protein